MLRNRIGAFFPLPFNLIIHRIKLKAANVCFSKMIAKDSWSATVIMAVNGDSSGGCYSSAC
ncbi:hypothetical protein, partial [Turicimonas muris]